MSYSKMSADGMMLSIRSAVVTLWEAAYLLIHGRDDEKQFALKELEKIKRGLEKIREEGDIGFIEEHIHVYYQCDFKLSELDKFYEDIKKAAEEKNTHKLNSAVKLLESKSNEIRDKYNKYIQDPIPTGASF